ncbi:MAG: hypothetical protein ACHBN1_37220 [Heteroscytonema crispum UTEX LB 1556]
MSVKIIRLGGQDEPEPNYTGIYGIIKAGDIPGLQGFIASGGDINQVLEKSGWTPL